MWPDVAILLVTYNRPIEIRKVINALTANIQYPGKLHWYLADDNSPETYLPLLFQEYSRLNFSATVTNRQGWGANVNKGLLHLKEDYIFLIEDDYVSLRPIYLDRGIAVLETVPTLGVIRYDGIEGHTELQLSLKEAKNTQIGTIPYLQINRAPSNHLNIYSNRPHLRHRRLHDILGMYKESLPLGATESNYAHRVKSTELCPEFAILSDGIQRAFDHIGHSHQGTSEDVNFK